MALIVNDLADTVFLSSLPHGRSMQVSDTANTSIINKTVTKYQATYRFSYTTAIHSWLKKNEMKMNY